MAISYNTGTTSSVGNTTASGHTFAIPAGVLNGDTVLVLVMCFTTASGTITPTLSSSKTAPVLVGSSQTTGVQGGISVTSSVFSIAAGASDASATLTYGGTGGSGGSYWFNVGLVSYTGAGSVDVSNGSEAYQSSATGNVTTPPATTVTAGDWQVQLLGIAPPNGDNFTVPGTVTQRQAITSATNAGLLLNIADSNGSVGGSGTPIGNTTCTYGASGGSPTWATMFTVGIAPPAAGVAGTVPALMTARTEVTGRTAGRIIRR